MNQTNILELAKKGDIQAITTLINKALEAKEIKVNLSVKDDSLTITAESEKIPDQTFLVEYLQKAIAKVNLEKIKQLYIRGQITGSKLPAWRQSINLEDNQISVMPMINKQNSLDSKVKSSKFNVFDMNGTKISRNN
ncbi:MAG: hypothetical protein HC815_29510 [Richelia sp. RM1_1_1]|nr:hypothetical protein [Richelia sp. RM1_1_1]